MTRKEAIEKGFKHYNGKPCVQCGDTLKYVSAWNCVACTSKRTKERDPKIFKRYIKSKKGQKWLKEFRRSETYRNVQNKWSVKSGFYREQMIRRRKQVKDSYKKLSDDEKMRIKEIYAEAARLSCETGIMYHVDHIIPLFENGKHHPSNLQILSEEEHWLKCAEENRRRYN
tara:strand:- start:45 stop:557 length:513 start_codon:yes stop_codon:yes gene_type:complete